MKIMKVKNSPGNFPRTGERRHFSRQKVNSLVYLNVKPDNGGILLDLSEGGMCVSVANPLPVSSRVEFSLGLGGNEMVEGTGLVSWLSQSGRSAGVCFVRLPEGSRRRVHEWLDGANATAEQNETRPVLVWPPASREKESSTGPRLEAVEPAVPPDMREPQALAEDPVVAATRELHPPPSHPIFARQPRPPAGPRGATAWPGRGRATPPPPPPQSPPAPPARVRRPERYDGRLARAAPSLLRHPSGQVRDQEVHSIRAPMPCIAFRNSGYEMR